GADTLYNTYWVRSNHGAASFEEAVRNTGVLIDAAREAGVRRVVHVSIANPQASDLPYYRGKAQLEEQVRQSGLSYAIIRPTLLFGHGDVLVNNIAWFLRHLPVFGIPGDGQYRLQPVFVEDYADQIVTAGLSTENQTIDVAGPEIFTFESLVRMLRDALGRRTLLVHVPPTLALAGTRWVSAAVRDRVLTGAELPGRMAELLVSGVALWPLFDLVGKDALPGLFALGLGFWFGATRRLPSGRALAIANAAVLVGLVLFIASWPLENGDIVSFLWIAAALAILFGWAMALPSFVRVLVSLRGRA